MEAQQPQFAVYPGGKPGRSPAPPGREYHELWFKLARIPWASVVLVPAEGGTSVDDIATSLAEVGTRLRETPVTAIIADRIDYSAARTLAEIQPRIAGHRVEPVQLETPSGGAPSREPPPPPAFPGSEALLLMPLARVIIAIQPVVVEPLGLAIAQSADAVVLCVEMGRSRTRDVRRTIDLIGKDRVVGALLVR